MILRAPKNARGVALLRPRGAIIARRGAIYEAPRPQIARRGCILEAPGPQKVRRGCSFDAPGPKLQGGVAFLRPLYSQKQGGVAFLTPRDPKMQRGLHFWGPQGPQLRAECFQTFESRTLPKKTFYLLFGKMAPATLEISSFSGNRLKIPPGAAFGGAPGALRAPGRRYFQPISTNN